MKKFIPPILERENLEASPLKACVKRIIHTTGPSINSCKNNISRTGQTKQLTLNLIHEFTFVKFHTFKK